jgi:hypothetical protein
MKTRNTTVLFLCIATVCTGQPKEQLNVNADNFPQISIEWKDYSLNEIPETDFTLTENGVAQTFDLSHRQEKCGKSILFLWEDLNGNGTAPYQIAKTMFATFFSQANLNAGDRFAVAVFSRERSGENLLRMLSEFTDDKDTLLNAVNNCRHNTVTVAEQPKYSDLYKAIYKGMDLLSVEPADRVKATVVFTSGWNLKGGGAMSEASGIVPKALAEHIPVYVALYPEHGTALEISTVADDTRGKMFTADNAGKAGSELLDIYRNMDSRHAPHLYVFACTADAKKDGKQHDFILSANGREVAKGNCFAVQATFTDWIKANVMLAAVIALLVAAALASIVVLIVRKIRKNQVENLAKIDEIENKRRADRRAAEQKQRELENQVANDKAERERREREKVEQAEEERLANLMSVKNLYPRLQCRIGDSGFVYNVSRVTTTIGRNDSNNLVLQHGTVSREHAVMKFNGVAFEIVNLSATNPMIINGTFSEQATLRSGDIIGLGEATVTFIV